MKKMIIIMMALVFAFTGSAFALDTVQMTLTSPSITGKGCEKAGAMTFAFDAGSTIVAGDWWYMDLPQNITICKPINYFLVAGAGIGASADNVTINDANAQLATLAGAVTGVPLYNSVPSLDDGPFSYTDADGVNSPLTGIDAGVAAVGTTDIIFHVYGAVNTRRVWVYVYGDDATDSLIVGVGATFKIKILDGNSYQNHLLLNTDNDTAFGELVQDTINITSGGGGAGMFAPYVENTLCIDASAYTRDEVIDVSFDSELDKFTFTGDEQIAHINAASITLEYCKGATFGDIVVGGQNACTFQYETTASGYCPGFSGNRILLKNTLGTFGQDRYDFVIKSETQGVYFAASPAIYGFLPNADKCSVPAGGVLLPGQAFTAKNEAGTIVTTYPGSTCSVSATNRVREVYTAGGNITSVAPYDYMWVDLPSMVYDTSVVAAGVESKVSIQINKYPCGSIFSGTVKLGTFVTTCGTTAATTTLLFPWFPPMDGSIAGWWGGFAIVNAGSAAGTAALTFWEVDGDRASLTTPSIAVGGQWNAGQFADLIGNVTPTAGNPGTFGDANFAVTAVCNFSQGAGFGFIGAPDGNTGYTPYVLVGGAWH